MSQGLGLRRTQATYDTQTVLHAAALEASTGVGDIIDLGGGDQANSPVMYMDVISDVSAIEIATGDEIYSLILEGSSSATFASDIEMLGMIQIGDGSTLLGNTDVDSDTGRYVFACSNERNGRTYRYVRLAFVIAGTIATGINFSSYLAKRV